MTRVRTVLALLAGLVSLGLGRQTLALDDLLARAGHYVERYVETFSNVVAEEQYLQEVVWAGRLAVSRPASQVGAPQTQPGMNARRTLKSDLVLVKVGPPLEWRPYRDVFEVNGKPVRDRDERLVKLFMEPAATTHEQALRIAQESARFNLSNVGRTLNAPGLALAFLQPAIQRRFHFALDKREGDAWIVKYQEHASPTLFRHNGSLDNPSTGRFWIDADTGVVMKVEHIVNPEGLLATFTTIFRQDKQYGIAVPVEMREEASAGPTANGRLTGKATYGRFRQFEVNTETVTGQAR